MFPSSYLANISNHLNANCISIPNKAPNRMNNNSSSNCFKHFHNLKGFSLIFRILNLLKGSSGTFYMRMADGAGIPDRRLLRSFFDRHQFYALPKVHFTIQDRNGASGNDVLKTPSYTLPSLRSVSPPVPPQMTQTISNTFSGKHADTRWWWWSKSEPPKHPSPTASKGLWFQHKTQKNTHTKQKLNKKKNQTKQKSRETLKKNEVLF